jgi:hypothetical protein
MPSNFKSPYATTFKSPVKRGASWNNTVNGIATRNGKWIYWPCEGVKKHVTNSKHGQWQMWQWFTEWCLLNGCCTPEQMWNNTGSQKDFMTWCRKFFGKQFTTSTTTKRRTTKNYKFSGTTRKYRRAA